jgi:PHD/YefM family antitoxin component YafN of YafNO toxin-antitoxin module
MSIAEQIITDKKGNPVAVLVPIGQYRKMKEMLYGLGDIKAFDIAMKRKHKFAPFDEAIKKIRLNRRSRM